MSKNKKLDFHIFPVSKIPKQFRKKLVPTFEDADDPFLEWIKVQKPDAKACIATDDQGELTCWACFSYSAEVHPRLFVWTKSDCRRRGYATETITTLMEQEGWRIKDRAITAYSDCVRKILNKLGFCTDWTNC